MKRLVLLGEGIFLDREVIRTGAARLVRWDKSKGEPDYSQWVSRVALAARRRGSRGCLSGFCVGICRKENRATGAGKEWPSRSGCNQPLFLRQECGATNKLF